MCVCVCVLCSLSLATHIPRHNLAHEYEETLKSINTDMNIGPEEEQANNKLDAMMKDHIQG